MARIAFVCLALSFLAAPVAAADQGAEYSRPGIFLGARVNIPLGGESTSRPRAGLALAPTQSRFSTDGRIRTRIGEGLELNLTRGNSAQLQIAGTPISQIAGFRRPGGTAPDGKAGISTVGWVAIGAGTILVAGAVGFALWADKQRDRSD